MTVKLRSTLPGMDPEAEADFLDPAFMPEVDPNSQPQDLPQAQEANPVTQSNDRQAFQNDWMSTTGTFDDFMKSHPQYTDYAKKQGTSQDRVVLGNDEVLDLVGDVGGQNAHNWTGTGFNAQGVPDRPASSGPAGAPPGLFGSLGEFTGGGMATRQNPNSQEVFNHLRGLFPGGAFNQDVVNRRVSGASDALNRQRKSTSASNKAALAERGLIGSGPEQTAQNRMDERLYDTFAGNVNDIYANESENADQRMMAALQTAAGMTEEEARMAIDAFRAQNDLTLGQGQLDLGRMKAGNDFTLGQGQLALGNLGAVNDYNLGMANYGLGRDRLLYDMDHGDTQDLMQILDQLYGGAGQSAKGYVK